MSYNNRRPHQNNRQQTNLSIAFTDSSYVDDAEMVIKTFKKDYNGEFKVKRDTLTTNQIRNLLSLTSNIYDDVLANGVDRVQEKIAYLRVQFVYQSGRNDAVKEFVRLADILNILKDLQKTNDKNAIIRFCRYMEALVAYFKYHGGRD